MLAPTRRMLSRSRQRLTTYVRSDRPHHPLNARTLSRSHRRRSDRSCREVDGAMDRLPSREEAEVVTKRPELSAERIEALGAYSHNFLVDMLATKHDCALDVTVRRGNSMIFSDDRTSRDALFNTLGGELSAAWARFYAIEVDSRPVNLS